MNAATTHKPLAVVAVGGNALIRDDLHMALADVFAAIDEQAILDKARLVDSVMQKLSGIRPRIGVCALNPHAGEEGLFGHEEQTIIRPAVERSMPNEV